MTSEKSNLVRFLPFRSVAEPSFWLDHNSRKLNELRLSEEGIPLRGFFSVTSPPTIAAVRRRRRRCYYFFVSTKQKNLRKKKLPAATIAQRLV